MSERFAVDANAVIDFIRADRNPPPQLSTKHDVYLPLPVFGELLAGAHTSKKRAQNLAQVEGLMQEWTVVAADVATARIYGTLRGDTRFPLSTSRRNDLWIAALCLQHNLPLLTNDRGFDSIPGLVTIHW